MKSGSFMNSKRKDLGAQVGAFTGEAVTPHERLDDVLHQRLTSAMRVEHLRAAVRQSRFEQCTGQWICDDVRDALEHPPMIEQHEYEADVRRHVRCRAPRRDR